MSGSRDANIGYRARLERLWGEADMSSRNSAGKPRVAIVGGGYMGTGMAQVFALSGHPVVLCDVTAELAHAAVERACSDAERYELDELFPRDGREAVRRHVEAAGELSEAVEDADYVAEVVTEDSETKRHVLESISTANSHAVIASNTSAIPISELQQCVSRPERFAGAHWMNPAPFVPCVEVIAGDRTSQKTIDDVMRLMRRLGKHPVHVADSAGFVANRLQFALFQEAARMVEEGVATPEVIDDVVTSSFGFRLPFIGPFRGADMAGLDVYVGAYESLEAAFGERFRPPAALMSRVSDGMLGVKSGAGFTVSATTSIDTVLAYRDRGYHELSSLKAALEASLGTQAAGQHG